jgi:hypothetical protein
MEQQLHDPIEQAIIAEDNALEAECPDQMPDVGHFLKLHNAGRAVASNAQANLLSIRYTSKRRYTRISKRQLQQSYVLEEMQKSLSTLVSQTHKCIEEIRTLKESIHTIQVKALEHQHQLLLNKLQQTNQATTTTTNNKIKTDGQDAHSQWQPVSPQAQYYNGDQLNRLATHASGHPPPYYQSEHYPGPIKPTGSYFDPYSAYQSAGAHITPNHT